MTRYEAADYARLGQAVYEARTEAGLGKTTEWAQRVQRSSRVLLGLERGEKVGTATMNDIEDALGWPRGGCYRVMSGGVSWRELTVGGSPQDEPSYVESPGSRVEGGESGDATAAAIEAMRRDMLAMEERLSSRLERLEHGPESVGGVRDPD